MGPEIPAVSVGWGSSGPEREAYRSLELCQVWEKLRLSAPAMIDCSTHGQHAITSCKKIGSRFYCPRSGEYLGAESSPCLRFPVTWWRDVFGDQRRGRQIETELERLRELARVARRLDSKMKHCGFDMLERRDPKTGASFYWCSSCGARIDQARA